MRNVTLVSRATSGEYTVPNNKKEITIGRDVKGGFVNDIGIPNIYESRHVSKKQCKLYRYGNKLAVGNFENLHRNYVNGKPVWDKRIVLENGFILGLADFELEVRIEGSSDFEEALEFRKELAGSSTVYNIKQDL